MDKHNLTAERLREVFSYDAGNGLFRQKTRTSQRVRIGDIAGSKRTDGYVAMRVDGKHYAAHRLAWFYVHGVWPEDQIDHINGVRHDNRICNLRTATRAENGQNRAINKSSASGYLGVSWYPLSGKWLARIRKNGKLKHIGYFDTAERAHAAYLSAKLVLHTFNPTVRECLA